MASAKIGSDRMKFLTCRNPPHHLTSDDLYKSSDTSRLPFRYAFLVCVSIELLLFVALCSVKQEVFRQVAWQADTTEYNRVATEFANTFRFPPTQRTIGYPLFIALGYLIAGPTLGLRVVIGLQLMLNL